MKFNVISNFRETSCFFLQFFVMLLVLLCLCHDCDSSSATATTTTTTTTTILQPVYRTTCISCPPPQLSNGGFCLSKVFSAHVPLLMAVSEFWLRRICGGSLQLHYVHCSTLFVIVSAFIFVFCDGCELDYLIYQCMCMWLYVAVEGSWWCYFVCRLESSEWIDSLGRRRLQIQGQCHLML